MLVRPTAERGFDVLMVRRSAASHFVPEAYVFPGGTVDATDYESSTHERIYGLDLASVRAEFRMPEPVAEADARALVAAALRELYEEAGVLLACDARGEPMELEVPQTRTPYLRALEASGAYGDARRLSLFSQWITPRSYPRRYNAHFFLAVASSQQRAAADAVETHDGVWIPPRSALERHAGGSFALVYPTIKHLERLAQFDDVAQLQSFAKSKPIRTITPDHADAGFSLPHDLEMSW